MRSPTCLLESRVYSSKNLRSTVQKNFYNTICHKPTFRGSPCAPRSQGQSRRLRDVHGESGLPPTQDEGRIPAISLGPFRKINYAVAAPAVSPRYAHIENGASELLVEADSDVIVFSNAEAQALTIS
jgi:hypothetical protein